MTFFFEEKKKRFSSTSTSLRSPLPPIADSRSLSLPSFTTTISVICHRCQRPGHFARDCDSRVRVLPPCLRCGSRGCDGRWPCVPGAWPPADLARADCATCLTKALAEEEEEDDKVAPEGGQERQQRRRKRPPAAGHLECKLPSAPLPAPSCFLCGGVGHFGEECAMRGGGGGGARWG